MNNVLESLSLTEEQKEVVSAVAKKGRNAVVNAVAGSGKTRTALATAIAWLLRQQENRLSTNAVLLVVYNKRLQQDMLAQRGTLCPPTLQSMIDVYTIHGFGHRYFGGESMTTDRQLSNWIRLRAQPTSSIREFGLVIIDEAQDLTPILFNFLHYSLSLFSKPQLLILGDPFQLLYRFKGADETYLLDADERFSDVVADMPFDYIKLSICFRISHEMAMWINENLNPNNLYRVNAPFEGWFEQHKHRIERWWGEGIRANPKRRSDPLSVQYHRRSTLDGVVGEIEKVFREFDVHSSAVLSPSIPKNRRSPIRLVTNMLKYVDNVEQSWFFDDHNAESGTNEFRLNHRVASTIHKFKGRETDAVVLLSMDNFPERVERVEPRNVFNMFYVGATRARKRLLIIQWDEQAYATHSSRRSSADPEEPFVGRPCSVDQLLSYCPFDEILCDPSPTCLDTHKAYTLPAISFTKEDIKICGAHTPRRLSTFENVLNIISVAVHIRLQLFLDDGVLEVPEIEDEDRLPADIRRFMLDLKERARTNREYSWAELLEIATAKITVENQLFYIWRQTRDFASWSIVRNSGKLDETVRNLVRFLDAVCGEDKYNAEKKERPLRAAGGVAYDEMITKLKTLRAKKCMVFKVPVIFEMSANDLFVQQQSSEIAGEPHILILSPEWVELIDEFRKTKMISRKIQDRASKHISNIHSDVKIVMVHFKDFKITDVQDDGLKIACYGAMFQQMWWCKRGSVPPSVQQDIDRNTGSSSNEPSREYMSDNVKSKIPRMYLAYPYSGDLAVADLHMDSFEFLHRLGFRKLNKTFDRSVLLLNQRGEHAPTVPNTDSEAGPIRGHASQQTSGTDTRSDDEDVDGWVRTIREMVKNL